MSTESTSTTGPQAAARPATFARAFLGGGLMGLANLVPGISGGTMLLAMGVYTQFIDAVADVTRLRLRRASLLFLLTITVAAALAIALLAGPVKDLVITRRWLAYSVFVGLTLGGIPALMRLARPVSRNFWIGAGLGFVAMAAIGLAQQSGATTEGLLGQGVPALFVAGMAGAASMILPGISGGYVLLILGQYVPILAGIDATVSALRQADLAAAAGPMLGVIAPVGFGLVTGVVAVSNLLRYLLRSHRAITMGVLLGLLAGVVVGLWPFQEGVQPEIGSRVKGLVVTAENVGDIPADDWPVRRFTPSADQMATSLALIGLGAAATLAASRVRGS